MMGTWVNGAAIFAGGDGYGINLSSSGTYTKTSNVASNYAAWHNTAATFEINDMDICYGHAASGMYHHHTYPNCLANKLADTGTTHSPIYGWINDGFPVYGPWQANGQLAQSCWKKRDYTSNFAVGTGSGYGGGCGIAGQRSCFLNNIYDITAGSTAINPANSAYYGPYTTETVVSQSGLTSVVAASGTLEDYYYDPACGASGGASLDQNNGHDHDGLGWHYHVTVDSTMTPAFPYIVGPKFKGCIAGAICWGLPGSQSSWPYAHPAKGWSGGSLTGQVSASATGKSQCYSGTFSYSLSQGTTTYAYTGPNVKKVSDNGSADPLDESASIGLGVGLGVGVPLMLLCCIGYTYYVRRSQALLKAADESEADEEAADDGDVLEQIGGGTASAAGESSPPMALPEDDDLDEVEEMRAAEAELQLLEGDGGGIEMQSRV